jgi:cell division protease FtsH
VFGEVSTGAQNDLEKATQIARAMVAEYGMSEKVGPLSLGRDDPNTFWQQPKISGETAHLIDEETRRLLDEAHDKADRILKDRRDLLDGLRELLLVVETIDGDDLEAYATGTKPIPDHEAARRDLDEQAAAAVAAKPPVLHARPAPAPLIPPAPPIPAD